MDYKTILVHLDAGKRVEQRIKIAQQLADAFNAHLTGLFALSTPRIPSYALAEAGTVVAEAEARYRAEAVRDAQATFKGATQRASGGGEFRVSSRDALAAVQLSARYADLVVVGQYDPESSSGVDRSFIEAEVARLGLQAQWSRCRADGGSIQNATGFIRHRHAGAPGRRAPGARRHGQGAGLRPRRAEMTIERVGTLVVTVEAK